LHRFVFALDYDHAANACAFYEFDNYSANVLIRDFKVQCLGAKFVAWVLTWKQVEQGVKISDFTVRNVPALLKKKGNAWSDFFDQRQTLKLN